jgi:hypothetical protein
MTFYHMIMVTQNTIKITFIKPNYFSQSKVKNYIRRGRGRGGPSHMYTHVSKYKNDK